MSSSRLRRVRDLARTTWVGATVAGMTSALTPVIAALSVKDPRRPDGLIRLWCRSVLRAADVRTQVEGLENLPPGQFILICNHQSHFDVPVIFSSIDRHLRFVAKAELYKIPVFGFALRVTGNLKVDRTGSQQ